MRIYTLSQQIGFALSLLFSGQILALPPGEMTEAAIAKRIQPIGSVYVEDNVETNNLVGKHHVAKTSHHEAPNHSSGKEIYANYCYICHQEGVAGAPVFGNHQDWQPRANKGITLLTKHALEGYRYMPPLGTCLECSDEEIKAAVSYMVENSIKH